MTETTTSRRKRRVSGHAVRLTAHNLIVAACEIYGLTRAEMMSKSREYRITHPRQWTMTAIVQMTGLSYPQVGRMMNGLDHTTVMHAVKATKRRDEQARVEEIIDHALARKGTQNVDAQSPPRREDPEALLSALNESRERNKGLERRLIALQKRLSSARKGLNGRAVRDPYAAARKSIELEELRAENEALRKALGSAGVAA